MGEKTATDGQGPGLPDSDVLAQLEVQAKGLSSIFPPLRVASMLLRRFPRELVQRALPGVTLPESVPAPADTSPAAPAQQPVPAPGKSQPTSIGKLLPGVISGAADQAASVPRDLRDPDEEECGFQFVPWIQCTFPHSDLGPLRTYSRVNGDRKVIMSATDPDYGLPYGIPVRLLTIYIVSEIVRTRSREVFVGKSMTNFLRLLDVTITHGQRGTFKAYNDQLKRLANCVFTFNEKVKDTQGRQGLFVDKELFIETAAIWDAGSSNLLIAQKMADAILDNRAAPLKMEVVRDLRRSPMVLDIYTWLIHRLYRLKRPSLATWSGLSLQFGQSYDREFDFRCGFLKCLTKVLKAYPEARVKARTEGLLLLPSGRHIAPRRATAKGTC